MAQSKETSGSFGMSMVIPEKVVYSNSAVFNDQEMVHILTTSAGSTQVPCLSHVNYLSRLFLIHLVRLRNGLANCRARVTITTGYYKGG